MKHSILRNASLPLFAAVLTTAPFVRAQTSFDYISYQGRVTDASGTAIGDSAPVNRSVTIKVYNHPVNAAEADVLFAEQQVATISKGEFSILIGQGTAVTGLESKGKPNVSLLSALASSPPDGVYLGVSVDDGTSAADPEISPRQRIVATPYALRAAVASDLSGQSNVSLSGKTLNLWAPGDTNHGLRYAGSAGSPFAGIDAGGPVLFGLYGGILGTKNGGEKAALRWDTDSVTINTRLGVNRSAAPNVAVHTKAPAVTGSFSLYCEPSNGGNATFWVTEGGAVGAAGTITAPSFAGKATQAGNADFANSAGTCGNGGTTWSVGRGTFSDVAITAQAPNVNNKVIFIGMNAAGTEVYRFIDGIAYKSGAASWTTISDERTKKNVHNLDGALDKLMQLRPVTFEYKAPEAAGGATGVQVGFIAQEVEKVLPSWVGEFPASQAARDAGFPEKLKMITEQGTTALVVRALRELREEKDRQLAEKDARIAALEKQIAGMAKDNDAREDRLEALEEAVKTLVKAPAGPAARKVAGLK